MISRLTPCPIALLGSLSLLGLVGMLSLLAAPASAQANPVFEWAQTSTLARVDAAQIPAPVKAALAEIAATSAGRPVATLRWVIRATPPAKKTKTKRRRKRRKTRRGKRARPAPAPRFLVLATVSSAANARAAHAGLLLLIEADSGTTHVLAKQPVPKPAESTWRKVPGTDVDGDGKVDAILEWAHAARNFSRNGLLVARTNPPALAMQEIASKTVTGRGTRTVTAQTACFFPVRGFNGKALIVQRREVTAIQGQPNRELDAMELLLPRADGRLSGGHIYGAMYSGDGREHDVLRRWGKVFALRNPRDALARQALPGACPANGVVVPQRALGQTASPHPVSIVGPFAMSSDGVRHAIKAMGKRGPRAIVVVGIGGVE